ncbi:hypothetical protein GLW00_12025 [Halobacillus litoralis]|uniref:Uncharacterized protein n=1 Tax=Halobacillus litoralis TaxID=45668 RepID=A0A845FD71_9BACI|nr:hypothetical protein [Halobacillus litoralis]MYL71586.1 hypothetical protein [Halobacillus litoralis]
MQHPSSRLDYLIVYLETLSKIISGDEETYPAWVNEKMQQTCEQIESLSKQLY